MANVPDENEVLHREMLITSLSLILELLADLRLYQKPKSFRDTRLADLEQRVMLLLGRWGIYDTDRPDLYEKAHRALVVCRAHIREEFGIEPTGGDDKHELDTGRIRQLFEETGATRAEDEAVQTIDAEQGE